MVFLACEDVRMASKKRTDGTVNPEAMAERFAAALKAAGLSKASLAAEAGVDPSMLSRLASGERLPNPESLLKVCARLGVSLDYLVTGRDPSGVPASVLNQNLAELLGDLTESKFMKFANGASTPPSVKDALLFEFHFASDAKRFTPSNGPEWAKIMAEIRDIGFKPEFSSGPLPAAGRSARSREAEAALGGSGEPIAPGEPEKNRPRARPHLTRAKPRKP